MGCLQQRVADNEGQPAIQALFQGLKAREWWDERAEEISGRMGNYLGFSVGQTCVCVCVGGGVASGSRIRIKHTWTAAARWFVPCFWNNELQKRKEKHKKIASNGACYSDRRSELCAA